MIIGSANAAPSEGTFGDYDEPIDEDPSGVPMIGQITHTTHNVIFPKPALKKNFLSIEQVSNSNSTFNVKKQVSTISSSQGRIPYRKTMQKVMDPNVHQMTSLNRS